jgi:hypothetical protein
MMIVLLYANLFHWATSIALLFFLAQRFFLSFMQIRYGYGITVPGTAALLPVGAGFE